MPYIEYSTIEFTIQQLEYINQIAEQQNISQNDAIGFLIEQSKKTKNLVFELEAEKLKLAALRKKHNHLLEEQRQDSKEEPEINSSNIEAIIESKIEAVLSKALRNTLIEFQPATEKVVQPQQIFDFNEVSNADLWDNPRQGSATERAARSAEKVRRCFLALAAYNNDIATRGCDRLAVTNQALREISGCNGQVVGAWIQAHADEVVSHNEKHKLCKPGQLTSYYNKRLGAEKITELLNLVSDKFLDGVALKS